MRKAYVCGQIFARIKHAGVSMNPQAYQLVSADPAHQLPPLFARLMRIGKGDTISDLMDQFDSVSGFPGPLTAAEQSDFSLGYYHEQTRLKERK